MTWTAQLSRNFAKPRKKRTVNRYWNKKEKKLRLKKTKQKTDETKATEVRWLRALIWSDHMSNVANSGSHCMS